MTPIELNRLEDIIAKRIKQLEAERDALAAQVAALREHLAAPIVAGVYCYIAKQCDNYRRNFGSNSEAEIERGSAMAHALDIVSRVLESHGQRPVTGWLLDTAEAARDYEARIRADERAKGLADFITRQIEFSRRNFGEGPKTAGVTDHIRKELLEIQQDPADIIEWIDVIILAFDGYWRHGGDPAQLMRLLEGKFAVNQARKWGPIVEGKAIEHIRESEPS